MLDIVTVRNSIEYSVNDPKFYSEIVEEETIEHSPTKTKQYHNRKMKNSTD